MELTPEKSIREVLDIFTIDQEQDQEHVKEVRYKFVNHPHKDDN